MKNNFRRSARADALPAFAVHVAPITAPPRRARSRPNGGWETRCETPPGARDATVRDRAKRHRPGPAEITLVVIVLKTADRKSRLLRVIAPLGVLLPTGLGLHIDNDDFGRMTFVRCQPNGCVAEVFLDDKLLDKSRAGAHGDVRLVRDARRRGGRADAACRFQGRI